MDFSTKKFLLNVAFVVNMKIKEKKCERFYYLLNLSEEDFFAFHESRNFTLAKLYYSKKCGVVEDLVAGLLYNIRNFKDRTVNT